MKLLNNSKGFSLIELMVVVAIIGILAAVGVPQYTKFQSKARQSEAKTSLGALYTAEISFFTEWNQYSADLVDIGMSVSGTALRYTSGFGAVCGTVTTSGAPAEAAGNMQTHMASVNTGANPGTWHPLITNLTGGTIVAAADFTSSACTAATSFTAAALGNPRQTPAAVTVASDTWTINNVKLLANTVGGL